MDLMKFKGVDNAVKMTIRLSIGYCVVLTIAFMTCIIYQTMKLEKAYRQRSEEHTSELQSHA